MKAITTFVLVLVVTSFAGERPAQESELLYTIYPTPAIACGQKPEVHFQVNLQNMGDSSLAIQTKALASRFLFVAQFLPGSRSVGFTVVDDIHGGTTGGRTEASSYVTLQPGQTYHGEVTYKFSEAISSSTLALATLTYEGAPSTNRDSRDREFVGRVDSNEVLVLVGPCN